MRGEKLGANLPLFWNNDGKDRPKGQIFPLAKKEVFDSKSIWEFLRRNNTNSAVDDDVECPNS
jgi:hypothetical protein